MTNTTNSVLIAGGGPTGLMLAAELALARVDVAIVERRTSQELAGSRAGGLHARTIELLDQRGVAERFLTAGKPMQVAQFADAPLDISDFPTRHNYGLALWQNHIERLLAAWVDELGVTLHRGAEITGFTQDDAVHATLSDGRTLHAEYLVGCDGGRSTIRKQAGIEFAGWEASTSSLIAEAAVRDEPVLGIRHGAHGVSGIGRLEDGKRVRIVLTEAEVHRGEAPSLDELRAALIAEFDTDFGVHDVSWLSRFSDATRQAVSYREGRVLLAGDAAHIHSPVGGQGLNLGVHDAVNLGWKLARVLRGHSSALLDTYQAERHPVTQRILQTILSACALHRGDVRTKAVRAAMTDLLKLEQPRKRYAGMLSGLDIHYDLGAGHPLLGRRMPDLEVATREGPRRVYSWLHQARPLLLNLGAPLPGAIDARYDGPWELPVLGAVPAPSAVLVRPDGYVAWVGDGSEQGLGDALSRWGGPSA